MELGECSTSIPPQAMRRQGNPFDGVTPLSSSTSPAVMKKRRFDVFINHRGCDTKHTLASTIYHTLDLIGIHAFLDEEELELGDSIPVEIQEAMQTARLHIAIFSEKYAESAWGLAELFYMLHTGAPIIPVFYDVDPSDLRWVAREKGCYAAAFSQHKINGRYSNKLQDWITALQRASNLSGHVLKKNVGDEGMLLKSIVNAVLRVMKKEPLEVAKHPVGMDEIVQDFERSRKKDVVNEEGVEIVGIVGLGGSGKTTLATELYNRKISSINYSSFLFDVRDAASRKVLHTKQKKLLKDVRIETESFDNVKEGKAIIADRLKSVCVLIVLDDVDHEDQLDALLPPKKNLERGSVGIITTRDMEVLTKWGIKSIDKIKPLQDLHAKQLFCWHAFLQPFPLQGFEDLVESFLKSCSGLPLSLKVIGGQLYCNRSRDYWDSQLRKIQRILPNEILERLKVSYDALDEDEKEIFLDIACLLIDERKYMAIDVWDASGWSGLCSWEALQNKCLVESYKDIDKEEHIRMHDHLRDLGRQIAKTHSPQRIWVDEGTPFRGITASGDRRVKLESRETFEAIESTKKWPELLKGVLWLEWSNFEGTSIPSWLPLQTIRVLEFPYPEYLETLWEDTRPPLHLRELRVIGGFMLRSLPRSIGRLQHLKRLTLKGEVILDGSTVTRLSSLPEEFCELQLLEYLDLRGCNALSSLPNRFGKLVNLRHLDLSLCSRLKGLPKSFKQLIDLKYLDINCCPSLESLDNIANLKAIYVGYCFWRIRDLTSVGELSLCFKDNIGIRTLLPMICQLNELKELQLDLSEWWGELPNSFGNMFSLTRLMLKDSFDLKYLPIQVSQMSSLQNLTIDRCKKLYEISNLVGLVSLTNLEVKDCYELQKIEISQMSSLENLTIEGCEWLYQISNLVGLVSLTNFEVKYCYNLQKIEISQLVSLTNFEVKCCYKLQKIEILQVSSLQNLTIERCRRLYEISNLTGLISLTNLEVKDFYKLHKIEGLEHLTSLENLVLWGKWRKPIIESLAGLERLQTLNLRGENISNFRNCIQNIQMENWPSEMTICGEVDFDFESDFKLILDSFTSRADGFFPKKEWSLIQETSLSNAIVVCYLVKSIPYVACRVRIGKAENTCVRLPGYGEWIVISVFKEVSYLVEDGGGSLLSLDIVDGEVEDGEVEVLGGGVMVRERACILDGFKKLFQPLSDKFDVVDGEVEVVGGWVMVGERACILDGFKKLFQTLSDVEQL